MEDHLEERSRDFVNARLQLDQSKYTLSNFLIRTGCKIQLLLSYILLIKESNVFNFRPCKSVQI